MDRSDWLVAVFASALAYAGIMYLNPPSLPDNVTIVEKGGFQWKKLIQDRLPQEPL
jgi:hypothetical protein